MKKHGPKCWKEQATGYAASHLTACFPDFSFLLPPLSPPSPAPLSERRGRPRPLGPRSCAPCTAPCSCIRAVACSAQSQAPSGRRVAVAVAARRVLSIRACARRPADRAAAAYSVGGGGAPRQSAHGCDQTRSDGLRAPGAPHSGVDRHAGVLANRHAGHHDADHHHACADNHLEAASRCFLALDLVAPLRSGSRTSSRQIPSPCRKLHKSSLRRSRWTSMRLPSRRLTAPRKDPTAAMRPYFSRCEIVACVATDLPRWISRG